MNKKIISGTCSIHSLPFHYWWSVRGKKVLLTRSPHSMSPSSPRTLSEFSNLSPTLQHFLILPASREARVADENAHGHNLAAFGRIMGGRGGGEAF